MKTRKEIMKILKEDVSHLKEKFHVKTLGIFGSYVRGEQKEESDIDMLVEFERPVGFFKFIELEDYLSERLDAKVELVTPDALKPLIKPRIMEEVVYA